MSRRLERVAEQLRAEIARVLREEVADPRLAWVTLTRVDVAPDLSHALVFWSRIETEGETSLEAVALGLERASRFIRRHVAAALSLKRTPELRFRHDPSLELGDRTLATLRALRDDETT